MASLCKDKESGRWAVYVVCPDGKRRPVRLGAMTKRQAETAKLHIEELYAARASGRAPKGPTLQWLDEVPVTIRDRLERVELCEPREPAPSMTLGAWLTRYIDGRTDVKPRTLLNYNQARTNLLAYFGADKRLADVTPADADGFRIFLKVDQGLGEGTVRRRLKRAKQFFKAAVKAKLLDESPFADLKCGTFANPDRYYYVSQEEAEAVLEACPDAEWRLIFALCRYGGLRCPSELLRLTWADVNWDKERFTVHSPKTEHHAGKGLRVVPLFPELRPYLQAAFEEAEEGAVHVITRYRSANQNLRTQLFRIIERAGLTPWPKLFQNLRSTRQTELEETYPSHVVCQWIGNSESIAKKHYLQVTEDHYRRAVRHPVRDPVQRPSAEGREPSLESGAAEGETRQEPQLCGPQRNDTAASESLRPYRDIDKVPPRGLEPLLPG